MPLVPHPQPPIPRPHSDGRRPAVGGPLLRTLLLGVLLCVGCIPEEEARPVVAIEPPPADSIAAPAAPDWFSHYDRSILPPFTPPDTATVRAWVNSVMDTLTVDEKLGQLLLVDLRPRDLPGISDAVDAVQRWHVGGFLVPRLMSPINVLLETQRLQNAAAIPLFFAADYERGAGRFNNNLTELPSNMALGASRRADLAEAAGRLTALESRTIGINLLFAPVVDVNNNPDNPIINTRSYGEHPELVGEMAAAFVHGAQSEGVMTTLKHFPGHGNTATDSHTSLGTVASTAAELDSVELAPYRVVLSGKNRPAGVMSAHLWVQALDSLRQPATFSPRALSDVLRDSLDFSGFVVTDAIRMGALRENYSDEERILRPLLAGADVLLTPHDPARALAILRNALMNGQLTEERVDQSVRRVLTAKAQAGLPWRDRSSATEQLRYLEAAPRGEAIARQIAAHAPTLLRTHPVLPLKNNASVLLLQITNQTDAESIVTAMERLARALGPGVTNLTVTGQPTPNTRAQLTTALETVEVVVLTLYLRTQAGRGNVSLDAGQEPLVEAALSSGKPTVLVPFGNPYVVNRFPTADAMLVLYDQTLETVDAAAAVLRGEAQARGKLPITVGPFSFNSGLEMPPRPAPAAAVR